MFLENSGFYPPNHPWINRVFHYFNHPFLGTPIFGNTHIFSKWPYIGSRGCNCSKHHFGYGFVEFRVCKCCFFGKQKVSIECKFHMDVQDWNNHSEGSLVDLYSG